ncbi:MAG: anaerobic glycerol-3-phosphate dehydrogenase subunit C [Acidobacteriia bacterium]|nr:anaerobic glycerol-3-phosphate dehydrogenase subunit C [Terriglobia bacterium]
MKSSEQIQKDLKQLVKGDVRFDDVTRTLFATAACIYRIMPLGVVSPRDAEDVVRVVQYCHEERVPITGRGGGSSLAGQAVGAGIILDFPRYMHSIVRIEPEENRVTAQPGIIFGELNKALAPHGKFFAPDPSSGDFCVVGGMLGTNAAGPHTLKYGTTKDHVLEISTVLHNGELATLKRYARESAEFKDLLSRDTEEARIHKQIIGLIEPNRRLIADRTPNLSKNSCGYNLREVISNGSIDLTKVLVGSEGTLGLVTEAVLHLEDLPAVRGCALAYFDDWRKASAAVVEVNRSSPSACEVMDRTFVDIVRAAKPTLRHLLLPDTEAMLLIEFEAATHEELHARVLDLTHLLKNQTKLASEVLPACEPAEQQELWAVRKAALPILFKANPRRKPMNFIDDAAVEPIKLWNYIFGLREIFKRYDVEGVLYGHAGNGNIHVNPLMDPHSAQFVDQLKGMSDEAFDLAIKLGGTISAEHGDGILRAPYIRREYQDDFYDLLVQTKRIFDPLSILNPGKIITEDTQIPTHNLRFTNDYELTGTHFDEPEWRLEIEKCHGCGACQNYCPVAKATHWEESSARAKANLLMAVIRGEIDPERLATDELKTVADLCFNCKLCLTECPTAVDVPRLAIAARSFYVEKHGMPLKNWMLGKAELTSRLGSLLPGLTNFMNHNSLNRAILDATVGIDHRRDMPEFRHPFQAGQGYITSLGGALRRHKVVYFPGCFARFNDPEGEAAATVTVLEKNDCDVYIPDQRCCSIALFTMGAAEAARADVEFNIRILIPLVEAGFVIVASAPSCGLAIKEDWPQLMKNDAAQKIAANTYDIHQFLWKLYQDGELNTCFGKLDYEMVYHNACHLKTQGVELEPIELMRLVPGVRVKEIKDSCCGIAGTYGFKKENFDLSMEIGNLLFDEIKKTGVKTVTTSCGTCNIQVKQGTQLNVIHPMRVLKEAYEKAE